MPVIHSFSPVIKPGANILVLGSMPGKRSLQANQYYAHPRNAFWRIFCNLFNIDEKLILGVDKYRKRIAYLEEANIALWDVLQCCTRESSLDADIVESSIIANNFSTFLDKNKSIKHIYFNGAKAEQLYKRHVIPTLSDQQSQLPMTRLPSTSPAYAAMCFEEKMQEWQLIKH